MRRSAEKAVLARRAAEFELAPSVAAPTLGQARAQKATDFRADLRVYGAVCAPRGHASRVRAYSLEQQGAASLTQAAPLLQARLP